MKTLKLFFIALASSVMLAGCDDDNIKNPFSLEFSVDDAKIVEGKLNISDKAYNNYIILSSNTNSWSVDCTPSGSWITVTKVAEGNDNRIKVEAAENDGFDQRTATVTFKYDGRQVGTFEVRQAGSAPILEIVEESASHSLPSDESPFEIILNTNTEYTVSYDPADMEDWIVEEEDEDEGGETRAVGTTLHTLKFKALENEELDSRSGKIIFTAGEIVREATVSQLGNTPDILVAETPRELAYDATVLEIEVTSNVAYSVDVEYTDGDGWLTAAPQGFGMEQSTVKYIVTGNPMAESRSAKVVFTYEDIRKEVPVTQKGNLVMSITDPTESSLTFGFEAGTLSVTVAANTATAPSVSSPSWLIAEGTPSTAGDGLYTYSFSYARNTGAEQSGTLTFSIYGTSKSISLTQKAEILYQDQIRVVGATFTSQMSGQPLKNTYDGDFATYYDSDYGVKPYPTETLTYELEYAPDLGHIMYYPRTNGTRGCFKDVELSVASVDNPTDFTLVKEFTVPEYYNQSNANASEGYKIEFDTPLSKVKFVKFFVKTTHAEHISCSEMQFFRTAGQNDEYAAVVDTDWIAGDISGGNYVPVEGATYRVTLSTNIEFPFEYTGDVTITEAPLSRALPERSEKTWIITIPANETGVWKEHKVYVKAGGLTKNTLVFPQIFDTDKVVVTANSYDGNGFARILDTYFADIWESNWGSGTGHIYTKKDGDVVREELPITITVTFPGGTPSASGMTIYPRGGNGDWTKFRVTAKTAADPTGTVVCTYDSGRIQTVRRVDFSPVVENITELFIEITGTSSTNTAAVKELVVWQ